VSIIEGALERSKRSREERSREGAPEAAAGASVVVSRKVVAAPERPAPVRLQFEQLPIDRRVCENERVLLSDDRNHQYSALLDSYRILRTRIWHRGVESERWSSLGIVSAGPGEGKTVTCINLALAFAREKRRNVFLLDLDLRNASICRYIGVTPRTEIGSAITGAAKPEQVFFGIGVENLFVAGGLTSYENSSEMLGGHGVADLLAYVNNVDPHALILVDLPPLLISADAQVVAPRLSAVALVVAEGMTRRDQLDRATELLAGVQVAGIVLNRSREAVEDYYS
jgi:Mrp family chromosome partitioning ATPase